MADLTRHAERRRIQMAVDMDEIYAALDEPDMTYPSPPGHPSGRTLMAKGRIVVVVDNVSETVITVLWNGVEHERPPLYPMREA